MKMKQLQMDFEERNNLVNNIKEKQYMEERLPQPITKDLILEELEKIERLVRIAKLSSEEIEVLKSELSYLRVIILQKEITNKEF